MVQLFSISSLEKPWIQTTCRTKWGLRVYRSFSKEVSAITGSNSLEGESLSLGSCGWPSQALEVLAAGWPSCASPWTGLEMSLAPSTLSRCWRPFGPGQSSTAQMAG